MNSPFWRPLLTDEKSAKIKRAGESAASLKLYRFPNLSFNMRPVFPDARLEFPNENSKDIAEVLPKGSIENWWTVIEELGGPQLVSLPRDEDPESEIKLLRFLEVLSAPVVDLDVLRDLCWHGIPSRVRAICWQILLGCLPLEQKKRGQFAVFKRSEYRFLASKHYSKLEDPKDKELLQQIRVDCPRTIPKGAPNSLFKDDKSLGILERILLVWSKENPSTDYFQGLGDIAAAILLAMISSQIDLQSYQPDCLSQEIVNIVEADTYWVLTKMLNAMEPYYSHGLFPGMTIMMDKLRNLVKMVDDSLQKHLDAQSVEYVQFSLRWMLCLLTRELNVNCVHRLWDCYFAEGKDFSTFHIYVCAALLTQYAESIKGMEFTDLIMFLQKLPTKLWTEKDVEEMLVKRAYEIGEMEETLKESYDLAIQATGILLTLFVVVIATSSSMTNK